MNITDFFKATKRKIITLIILIILYEGLIFLDSGNEYVISSLSDIGIVLIIIIFYIISCLVTWILQELNKRGF